MFKQLTIYDYRTNLLFAEKQLKRYGAKEGRNYIWKQKDDLWAIFIKK